MKFQGVSETMYVWSF